MEEFSKKLREDYYYSKLTYPAEKTEEARNQRLKWQEDTKRLGQELYSDMRLAAEQLYGKKFSDNQWRLLYKHAEDVGNGSGYIEIWFHVLDLIQILKGE